MKIININKDPELALQQAHQYLQQDKVLIIPTSTSYGLAIDPRNAEATEKVYQIKNRDHQKPLLLLSDSLQRVQDNFVVNDFTLQIMQKYWPGPLTILLPPKNEELKNNKFICRDGLVAVRVSSNQFIQKLIAKFDFFITATSANISGGKSGFSAQDILVNFAFTTQSPDLFLDFGDLPESKPSTIIKILENDKIQVIRSGAVDIKI